METYNDTQNEQLTKNEEAEKMTLLIDTFNEAKQAVAQTIKPVSHDLNKYQANSENITTLKEANISLIEAIDEYLAKNLSTLKEAGHSNKQAFKIMFETLRNDIVLNNAENKDYTNGVINAYEEYYTGNVTLRKNFLVLKNFKALRGLKGYYSNKAINGLLSDKSIVTSGGYKTALDTLLNRAKSLKTALKGITTLGEKTQIEICEKFGLTVSPKHIKPTPDLVGSKDDTLELIKVVTKAIQNKFLSEL